MKKLSETSQNNNVGRVIDANLNRAKEGLRVCEEVARFILDDYKFTAQFKAARHKIDNLAKRGNCKDIFWANIQRIKESLRVLEEFSKLINARAALGLKQLRYKTYEIEKESFKKISALPR
ncbi:MAG: thiamine-phosphate pyrophosphorylase [Candidatus Omnitrophica bacterium]|nr:thiamine-phosphate pyrophosphorylase [Candidatus Omnitrophota bacterium]